MTKTVKFEWKRGDSWAKTKRSLRAISPELRALFWALVDFVLVAVAAIEAIAGFHQSIMGNVDSSNNHLLKAILFFLVAGLWPHGKPVKQSTAPDEEVKP